MDAILVACGGGACSVVRDKKFSIPSYLISIDVPDVPAEEHDSKVAEIVESTIDEAVGGFDEIRVVFVYAVLGGEMGVETMFGVIRKAREAGCKIVSVAGLPYEPGARRKTAVDTLPEVISASDRTLVYDGVTATRLIDDSISLADSIFRVLALRTFAAMESLVRMTEGPFFSTLPEPAYTYSYVLDIDPVKATERAMEATVFPTDPSFGKVIVTVSSAFGPAQIEEIFDAVANRTGIIPEIVKRNDGEDTKVLVFLPVRIGSSPKASRS